MCSVILIIIGALVIGYWTREIKEYFNQQPPTIEDNDYNEDDDDEY